MALNFPSSPTNGTTYTDSNAIVWMFDGVKWNVERGTASRMYSGAKLTVSAAYALSSTSSAISFDTETIDTDYYWNVNQDTRITVNRNAFYRINLNVYTGSVGSSFTIELKKNGSTTLSSVTIAPNQYTNFDEIVELVNGDYLEVFASESSSTGELTTNTAIEITRLGLTIGTAVSSADAFSGVRGILTTAHNTTTTSAAVSWDSTTFNVNADAAGAVYWTAGADTKFTVAIAGYYRLKGLVTAGSSDTVTVSIKKNNTTTLTSTSLAANEYAEIDDIYQFSAADYIELFAGDTASTGSLTTSTYLELVRIGV